MALVDTHAHLDDSRFASDLDETLSRARAEQVERVVVVATTAQSSRACLDLAAGHPMLSATVGVHPNNIVGEPDDAWDQIVRLSADLRVVGLGETGLDRHWHDTPFDRQQDFFARHLDLSRSTGLPVVIHNREADADMLRMLRAEFDARGPIRGVMHSFASDAQVAAACLEMGLHLSFAGMLTYKNADSIRHAAKVVPLDRVLVETDSPYLAPAPVRGRRNEPAFVVHTARVLADVLGVSFETLAERTTANASRLFQRRTPP